METITVNEAAERCHVTTRTVRAWLTDKKITRYAGENGYSVLISVDELDAFNTLRQRGPNPEEVEQLAMHGEPVTEPDRVIRRLQAEAYVTPGEPMPEFTEPTGPVKCIHGRELIDCPRCGPR